MNHTPLNEIISSKEKEDFNSTINIEEEEEVSDKNEDGETGDFPNLIDDIFKEAKRMVGDDMGDRDNLLQLPSILKPLKKITLE